jgi:hypothetical protein
VCGDGGVDGVGVGLGGWLCPLREELGAGPWDAVVGEPPAEWEDDPDGLELGADAWPLGCGVDGPALACVVGAYEGVGVPALARAALTCAGERASTTAESPRAPRPTAIAANAATGATTASATHPTMYLPRDTPPSSGQPARRGLRHS